MRILPAGLIVMALTCSVAAAQRRTAARNYDPATETTISGTVARVTEVKHGRTGGVHVTVETAQTNIEVELGPSAFLAERKWSLHPKDVIEVTGSRIERDGAASIIARLVRRDGQSWTLRDEKGIPAWSRVRKGRNPS